MDVDGYDRIEFGDGIAPEEIQVFADPNGAIVLQRYGTEDRIRIAAKVTNQWGDISVTPVIESFEFADGTVWTADDVAAYAMSAPTTGSDSLRGSDRPEIIDGLGGNDYAAGGQGDDSYVFKPGYGQLTINDSDGYSDALIFGDGIAPDDLVVRRDYDSLILEVTGTEDRVRVESQFSSWNTGSRIERFVFADGTEWNISTSNCAWWCPKARRVTTISMARGETTPSTGLPATTGWKAQRATMCWTVAPVLINSRRTATTR